jgi:hypothetical protein
MLVYGSPVITSSVCAGFAPDTTYSLLSGYWQNALLNVVCLMRFAIPLWATCGMRRNAGQAPAPYDR